MASLFSVEICRKIKEIKTDKKLQKLPELLRKFEICDIK